MVGSQEVIFEDSREIHNVIRLATVAEKKKGELLRRNTRDREESGRVCEKKSKQARVGRSGSRVDS